MQIYCRYKQIGQDMGDMCCQTTGRHKGTKGEPRTVHPQIKRKQVIFIVYKVMFEGHLMLSGVAHCETPGFCTDMRKLTISRSPSHNCLWVVRSPDVCREFYL